MSVIDHASAATKALRARARALRLPPSRRIAVTFALLQAPLMLVAIAFEWRTTWGTSDEAGPVLLDFLAYGSAVSGPLAPQLVLVVLAALARRGGARRIVGNIGIGIVGLLVTFNGLIEALSDSVWTPRPVHLISGLLFVCLGSALTASALHELTSHHTR